MKTGSGPVLLFSPLSKIDQCSILGFIYMLLLPEGQAGEASELYKKQHPFGSRALRVEKCVHLQSVSVWTVDRN